MSWLPQSAPNATEGKMLRTQTGNACFFNGAFYILNAPATAVTNTTTTTSLFGGDPQSSSPATTPIVVQLGQPPYQQYPGSTRTLPPMSLTLGTMFNGDFFGTVADASTATLRLQLGLIGPYPSTTFNVIADTTAVAMTTESTSPLQMNFGFNVQSYNSAANGGGTINAYIQYQNATTGIVVFSPMTANTAFDTTQQYTIDVRATWGAASSTNLIQLWWGDIEVIG